MLPACLLMIPHRERGRERSEPNRPGCRHGWRASPSTACEARTGALVSSHDPLLWMDGYRRPAQRTQPNRQLRPAAMATRGAASLLGRRLNSLEQASTIRLRQDCVLAPPRDCGKSALTPRLFPDMYLPAIRTVRRVGGAFAQSCALLSWRRSSPSLLRSCRVRQTRPFRELGYESPAAPRHRR